MGGTENKTLSSAIFSSFSTNHWTEKKSRERKRKNHWKAAQEIKSIAVWKVNLTRNSQSRLIFFEFIHETGKLQLLQINYVHIVYVFFLTCHHRLITKTWNFFVRRFFYFLSVCYIHSTLFRFKIQLTSKNICNSFFLSLPIRWTMKRMVIWLNAS